MNTLAVEHPPTAEQEAILHAARTTKENLLISALAGAAKTSTLVLLAKALRGQPILAIAFNKKIAEEMTKRLPGHCQASTLNSIGHKAWGTTTGKRLSVDSKKLGGIVTDLIKEMHGIDRDEARDEWADIVDLARKAKSHGYIPEGNAVTGLISREDLEYLLADQEYPSAAWGMLNEILNISIERAWKGTIDFDDQIYMPTLFGATWPRFPLVMVDEAQDLSPLNHKMLAKIVGTRRLFAVGDRHQSIYGFRGADQLGMDTLAQQFSMREMELTVSFRCPINVVKLARKRAPHMQWSPNAEAGSVTTLELWDETTIPDGAAIICRNNAPLISAGLALLRAGRGIELKAFDISKRIIKLLEDLGPPTTPREAGLVAVEDWRRAKIAEGKGSLASIEDRAACLRVFCDCTPDLRSAVAHARKIFSVKGPIELLTGHKSKGLEWENVFHLDSHLIGGYGRSDAEMQQEENLFYVITTRSKANLTHIFSEGYEEL